MKTKKMTDKEKAFEARLLAYYTPERVKRMALSRKAEKDLEGMMGPAKDTDKSKND